MNTAKVIQFPNRNGFEPWLNKKQLANHIGFTTRWIDLRICEGLPFQYFGNQKRFKISVVEEWFESYQRRSSK